MLNCPLCGSQEPNLERLKVHIRINHREDWKFPYRCGSCHSKTYTSPYYWARHIKSAHSELMESHVAASENAHLEPDISFESTNDSDSHLSTDLSNIPEIENFPEQLLAEIKHSCAAFVATLRSDRSVTAKTCALAVNSSNDSIETVVSYLRTIVERFLKEHCPSVNHAELLNMFDEVSRPFAFLQTVKKQDKYFESQEEFVNPERMVFKRRLQQHHVRGGVPVFRTVTDTWEYIPIEKTLKVIFSDSSMVKCLMETRPRTDDVIGDWVDGYYHKRHPLFVL